jgi:hypothetical protein
MVRFVPSSKPVPPVFRSLDDTRISFSVKLLVGFAVLQTSRLILGSLAIIAYARKETTVLKPPPKEWLLGFSIDVLVGLSAIVVIRSVIKNPNPVVWGLFFGWWLVSGLDHLEAYWLSRSTPYGPFDSDVFNEDNFKYTPLINAILHVLLVGLFFKEDVMRHFFMIS